MNEDKKTDATLAAAQHATLSGQDAVVTVSGVQQARESFRKAMLEGQEKMRDLIDRRVAAELGADEIIVKHTRAEIASNPKDFDTPVLVVELRAIAAQQMEVGRTSKMRTHFDRISGELQRRGLDNNGQPL